MQLHDLPIYIQFILLVNSAGVDYFTDADDVAKNPLEAMRRSSVFFIPLTENEEQRKAIIKGRDKFPNDCVMLNVYLLRQGGCSVNYSEKQDDKQNNSIIRRFNLLDNIQFKETNIEKVIEMLNSLVTAVSLITEVNPNLIAVMNKLFNSTKQVTMLDESIYSEVTIDLQVRYLIHTLFNYSDSDKVRFKYDKHYLVMKTISNDEEDSLALYAYNPISEIVSFKYIDKSVPNVITYTKLCDIRVTATSFEDMINQIVTALEQAVTQYETTYPKIVHLSEALKTHLLNIKMGTVNYDDIPF